jgi:hypothetical protein
MSAAEVLRLARAAGISVGITYHCGDTPHESPQKEKNMTTNQRFVLDENRYVIDKLNPGAREGYCHEGDPEDDIHLRERVLMVRLGELLSVLITPTEPTKKDRFGDKYQPFNEERHAIWRALLGAIHASYLTMLDPALSVQHKLPRLGASDGIRCA